MTTQTLIKARSGATLPVLIAGGGIGGLCLAIALARRGIASRIFEARDQPPREGAGIQLGPNATRILRSLRLADALAPHAVSPDCIIVNDGVSGRELTRLPLGAWIEARHGAPYWVVHRAALHEVLWAAAIAEPLVEITTGQTVTKITDTADADQITIEFADGGTAQGAMLVGADGLWSVVRRRIDPAYALSFSGTAAARALVPRDQVATRFAESATGVWMAPSAHVVHYPVDGGDTVAIVAIGACAELTDGWNIEVTTEEITARFARMPDDVRGLLRQARNWRQWPLYRGDRPAFLSSGRSVLIGDAAHPILPFLAQGGAMAIEDAAELAAAVADTDTSITEDIARFCNARRARVEKVQATSAANGKAYHLEGLAAAGRNAALQALPGSFFMRRYDWIYGYQNR